MGLEQTRRIRKRLQFDQNEGARSEWISYRCMPFAESYCRLATHAHDLLDRLLQHQLHTHRCSSQRHPPVLSTLSPLGLPNKPNFNTNSRSPKSICRRSRGTQVLCGWEKAIEVSFADLFCNLLVGSGWVGRNESV